MKRRKPWGMPPFMRFPEEPGEEGRPPGWRSPKLNYEVVEELYRERQRQLQSISSDEDDVDNANRPKATSEDDDAPHTKACRGKENTSGNESGAKEDDVHEVEYPMREDAHYGEPSALELFQDQRVSHPDLIPDWEVIEDANRCNRAILSKGKKGSPSLTPNQLGQTVTKPENITTTETENRTVTKAESRRPSRLPKAPAAKRAARKVPDTWEWAQIPYFKTQLDKSVIRLSPQLIFLQMLARMRKEMANRYQDHVTKDKTELFHGLRQYFTIKAWNVFESLDYSRENLLLIDCPQPEQGVYVHLLWRVEDPTDYRLYVGQSLEIANRICHHEDINYRKRHPCFHYYWWDLNEEDPSNRVESRYIFPCAFTGTTQPDPLILNMLEMWVSLILQSLSRSVLEDYLPSNTLALSAGRHLNLMNPLYQSSQTPQRGEALLSIDVYRTKDPSRHEYYQQMRRCFHNMKDSPDPKYRRYYEETTMRAAAKRSETVNQNARQECLNGKFVQVSNKVYQRRSRGGNVSNGHFSIWDMDIHFPARLMPIENNTLIWIKCYLAEPSKRHPYCYTPKSRDSDPSKRLGIWIKGVNAAGRKFESWVYCQGEIQVKCANTIVDLLQGQSYPTIVRFPRRFISPQFRDAHPELLPLEGLVNGRYTPAEKPPIDKASEEMNIKKTNSREQYCEK